MRRLSAGARSAKSSVEWDVDARDDPFLAEYERARDLLQGAEWRDGLKAMESLAYRGSLMSMLLVSDAMRIGWMYEQDLPGAEAWYRVAVESGSARGLFGLGLTYRKMRRFDEAIRELEAAVASGYPPAYNVLAIMYLYGEGVPVDRRRALELWRKGGVLGHLPSRFNRLHQSLHGRFGLWERIVAIVTLFPVTFEMATVRATNRYTDRLR